MAVMVKDGREFRMERDLVDATSHSRPDTNWAFVDAHGHEHRWWTKGAPAATYDALQRYEIPSLRYVVDDEWIDEDGYERQTGHSECIQCGERVTPARTSDTTRQMIPGLTHYYIDGERVSEDVFKREAGI